MQELRIVSDQQHNLLQNGAEHVSQGSAARVAHALGVERLTGRPVALPLAALLGGIGELPGPSVCGLP